MVRYPLAYPALDLAYNSMMSKKTLVDSLRAFPVQEGICDPPARSNVDTSQATPDSHVNGRRSPGQNVASKLTSINSQALES
jgi:hypothetical protein